jgi:hypothetical protein
MLGAEEPDRRTLFSLDIATKEVKTIGEIGKDFTPSSYSNPGVRLSLSPDGKSILYPATRRTSSLWMMEGFDQPGLGGPTARNEALVARSRSSGSQVEKRPGALIYR